MGRLRTVVSVACLLAGATAVGWTLLVFSRASMVAAAATLRLRGGAIYHPAPASVLCPRKARAGALTVRTRPSRFPRHP